MNLVLIGYRGTGKTTVAQQLGLRLGWDWVDADVELELRAGKNIVAIFADEGEPAFRDLESQVIADLSKRDRIIIAAGGGAVLREQNRQALTHNGFVIWLKATVATILERVQADQTTAERRPNLTAQGGETEVRRLLAQREPLYQSLAQATVETDGKSPSEIAAEIVEKFGANEAVSS